MPGTGADGARVSHLSRRELVCLGQEKLLEPEEREGWSWEGECEGPGEDWSPDQTQRTCLTRPLVSLWCPPWGTQDPHLLILVHHPLAAGVKHSESAQDGFLRVCPCGWRQPGELSDSQALGPTQEELILPGS